MSVWSRQVRSVAFTCIGRNCIPSVSPNAFRNAELSSCNDSQPRSRSWTDLTVSVQDRFTITPGMFGKSHSSADRSPNFTCTRTPSTPTGLHFAFSAATSSATHFARSTDAFCHSPPPVALNDIVRSTCPCTAYARLKSPLPTVSVLASQDARQSAAENSPDVAARTVPAANSATAVMMIFFMLSPFTKNACADRNPVAAAQRLCDGGGTCRPLVCPPPVRGTSCP